MVLLYFSVNLRVGNLLESNYLFVETYFMNTEQYPCKLYGLKKIYLIYGVLSILY